MERRLKLLFVLLFLAKRPLLLQGQMRCSNVMTYCLSQMSWTSCLEDNMRNCKDYGRSPLDREGVRIHESYIRQASLSARDIGTAKGHRVEIPMEVVEQFGNGCRFSLLVLNSSLFKVNADVMGNQVLSVQVGNMPVSSLSQPVSINFNYTKGDGTCTYWQELANGTGTWSTRGCETEKAGSYFKCRCNHLSFFAILVNSAPIHEKDSTCLTYITYVGCGLSVLCTAAAILVHVYTQVCIKKKREQPSILVHLQLIGSLLLLHLLFLLSTWQGKTEEYVQGTCKLLAFLLHWAVLATFTWMAIESFHLYQLLVRVFNIYIRRYTLKLSLVGWGVPSAVSIACAVFHPYGKHGFQHHEGLHNSSMYICWITSPLVKHLTITGYLSLVFLGGVTMLSIVLMKVYKAKKLDPTQKNTQLWRDGLVLLALSCVLGVPWGFAFSTYGRLSIVSFYLFTIINSFQGVFTFLWFAFLTCKMQPEDWSTSSFVYGSQSPQRKRSKHSLAP